MKYGIHLNFDCGGESPNVFIAEDEGHGADVLEILEEPLCKKGWSWDDEDWEVGKLAKWVLGLVNQQIIQIDKG